MAEPLTKEERDEIVLALVALKQRWGHNTWVEHTALRYEATVVALEAENARLRPLAEAVEKLSAADWEYVAGLLRAEGFASYERAVTDS